MTSPVYARIAAKLLARAPRALPPPAEAARARAIAHLELALAAKARKRQRARAFVSAAAVAAALAAVVGYHFRARPSVAVSNGATPVVAILQPTGNGAQLVTRIGSEPLRGGSSLPLGGRLLANAAGGASLQLSTGTQIQIDQAANLTFRDAGPTERFELSEGTIHAHVAKLHPGERFIVATPDAEIEVRGTQFQLGIVTADPTCGEGTRTRLAVSEGVVEVRAQGASAFVHPGESWPAGCGQSKVTPVSSTPVGSSTARPVVSSSRAVSLAQRPTSAAPAPSATPTVEASSLAEQNDLFAAGMAARRQGDARTAVSKFQELMARFPSSALSEGALAESMRAEQGLDGSAAQRFARQYLQRYPDGFARHDAQAILASP